MKLFRNLTKGNRFQIIGYIVFFTCWIIPLILIDGFKLQGRKYMIVMLSQMFVGGFLILFGGAINKRENDNPNYEIPKNFFRVFKAWQILLIVTALIFLLLVISLVYESKWLSKVLTIVMYGFAISATVVGIVQHQKNKKNFISVGGGKMVRANSRVNSVWCCGCNKLLNPDDFNTYKGKKYCYSCYMKILAEKQEKDKSTNVKTLKTQCSVCKRPFPQSAFHIVNNKFLCDDCFKKMFDVDLQ